MTTNPKGKYLNYAQKLERTCGPLMAKAYRAWINSRVRCSRNDWPVGHRNYAYNDVTHSLDTFDVFLAEVGAPTSIDHQIDRIDGKKGYESGNVRWVTPTQNRRNQRDIKIDFDTAERIRAEYKAGGITQGALGKRYGINQTMVGFIVRNERWLAA